MLNSPLQTPISKLQTKSSKLKICVLGTRGFPNVQGGVETHCENLYPQLVEKGCEVIILARRPYVGDKSYEYKGVTLIPLSCPKSKFFEAIAHTFKGVLQAQKLKPDILHIHAIGPSLFALLARIFRMNVVVTHHGPDYKREKWPLPAKVFLKFCERMGATYAHKIITIAQNIADDIKSKFGRDAIVIPNGVTIPKILESDGALKKYGLKKGKYILVVGRFVPEKGFHDLIDAFGRVQAQGCRGKGEEKDVKGDRACNLEPRAMNYKLVIVGDADHEDKYSKELRVRSREIKNVILTGRLTGLPLAELYSHAGLFVLPSYYEGLPIVLLEAMSYGLSCLVSDIPANRNVELREDRFFKAGDVQALAAKIREFVDKPFIEEESKQQISMITKKYNWEKIANQTLEVYRQVLE